MDSGGLGPFTFLVGTKWGENNGKRYELNLNAGCLEVMIQAHLRQAPRRIQLVREQACLKWLARHSVFWLNLDDCTEDVLRWRRSNGRVANEWRRFGPKLRSRSRSQGRALQTEQDTAGAHEGPETAKEEVEELATAEASEQGDGDGAANLELLDIDKEQVQIFLTTCNLRHKDKLEKENTFAVDVRGFWDPGCGDLRGHDGRNPEIIRRLQHHHLFEDLVGHIRSQLSGLFRAAGGPCTIGILLYCKSGKHRSVATGEILNYILLLEGYRHTQLDHASLEGCRCALCTTPTAKRSLACEEAHRKWRKAGARDPD